MSEERFRIVLRTKICSCSGICINPDLEDSLVQWFSQSSSTKSFHEYLKAWVEDVTCLIEGHAISIHNIMIEAFNECKPKILCVKCSHETKDKSHDGNITFYIDDTEGFLCDECEKELGIFHTYVCYACENRFEPYSCANICTKCPTDYCMTCNTCRKFHNAIIGSGVKHQ